METTKQTYTVRLMHLHCYFVEENEYDDVFLKYKGKKIWPKDKKQQPIMMDTITEIDVEISDIPRNGSLKVDLWDWDLLSLNDKLGSFHMVVQGDSGPFSTDMIQNLRETKKAKYTLYWEVY